MNTNRKCVQASTFYSTKINNTSCSNSRECTNHGLYKDKVYCFKPQHNKNIINDEVKSNYSSSSMSSSNINNISNSSIKSMINTIEGIEKFEDIKIKKYNISSKSSSNSINESKYIIKNYSHVNNNNSKNKILNKTNNNKQLSLLFKQKIENAKIDEEIILPPEEIELETLVISNPIKIKGQSDSVLYIKNGPILIDFTNLKNNKNKNFVKISQLRIIYTDKELNKEKKITTLFKIYPESYLELEDCDIVFQNKKNEIIPPGLPKNSGVNKDKKSVAFLLFSNKISDNYKNLNPSMLNLTNTRIQNFFQSIRAGQNCIVNINKSAFIQNLGKAIVMINPIFLKITESFFEYNGDNCIHLKFIEECLYNEKRKLFFNKNEFNLTMGNNICIEGVKNNKLDLSIVITKNNFISSIINGVLIYDLFYNYFEINDNLFKKNNGNGLNIQKVFFNELDALNLNSNNLNKQIKILNNKFIENKGFGLFINDCAIEVISNKFSTNRQSGMFLGDILIDEPKKGLENINLEKINLNKKTNINSKKCFISKNRFYENGANGLHIYGYPYQINILESIFSSNCQNGILLDLKDEINSNKIIEEFNKSNNINNTLSTANVILNKCIIEKNLKNGILLNYGLILCEESFIMNNMDYAIFTKKKEYRNCFKEGKQCEINGTLGGNWGEINLDKGTSCGFSCMPNKGGNINNKLKDEIIKKVPTLNDTDDNISTVSYNEIKCENKIKKDKDDNCIII